MMSSGTSDESQFNITLGLDQKWLNGNVTASVQGATVVDNKMQIRDWASVDWVHHSGVAFVPLSATPSSSSVVFGSELRTSSWYNITQGSSDPVSGNVFSASINHGRMLQHQTVSHQVALLPGIDAKNVETVANSVRDDKWLTRLNTFDAQAACWAGGEEDNGTLWTLHASLWYANATADFSRCGSVSIVKAPSEPYGLMVMLKLFQKPDTADAYTLQVTAADPHAVGGTAQFRVTGLTMTGSSCETSGNATIVTVNLPQDPAGIAPGHGLAGSSVTVVCQSS